MVTIIKSEVATSNFFMYICNMETKDFITIYKDRCSKLLSELSTLTVEEARGRYKGLWDGCPIELHIDDFSVIKELEARFPDFHIEGVTKKTYNITIK